MNSRPALGWAGAGGRGSIPRQPASAGGGAGVDVQQFAEAIMDVVVQMLQKVLTAAGDVMRYGSEEVRRRAAVLLMECARCCDNKKVALHLRDMAAGLQAGDGKMFWENWWWAWGYWEALADVAAKAGTIAPD